MNWDKDKSIVLSQVCVAIFALLLAALDVMVFRLRGVTLNLLEGYVSRAVLLGTTLCSLLAWPALFSLWRLLGNLKAGKVFHRDNIQLMRRVSWCFAGAALVCFVGAAMVGVRSESLIMLVLMLAAGLMALIVRIVKNVFQQAIAMKHELDLTV